MLRRFRRFQFLQQALDRQLTAILNAGISFDNIFIDKASGKDFQRTKYQELIKKMKEGDELYIKSIDRLGRNYDEIISEWNLITKKKNADIIVIDFPLLDTRSRINDLTGKFLADIVLQILSYVAQIERENIHQRQMEGIREAQKRGVKFGRSKKKIPKQFYKIAEAWSKNEISLRNGAKLLGISHTTLSKWLRDRTYIQH